MVSPLRKAFFCQTLRWIQILKYSFTIRLDFVKNTLLGVDSTLIIVKV